MAIPVSTEQDVARDELERISLAQSYFQMTESAAYKDLMDRIQGLVDEAQQELFSDMSPDVNQIVLLKTKWQQRMLTLSAIDKIVSTQLRIREEFIEEMKEGNNEHSDSNA